MKKTLFFVFGLLFSLLLKAQETPPEVSRFLQVNTYNGGHLSHLLSDQSNNSYMTGIANGTNFSFDGYNIKPIGNDDMFVIKTNATGQNQWLKTVNAGSKGIVTPYKSYLNFSGELYVSGFFKGTINFAGKTITSDIGENFVTKYGTDGSEKWIFKTSAFVGDVAFSANDTFVASIYDLFKIDDTDGTITASRSFQNQQFKINSITANVLNEEIYIGGLSFITGTIDGIPVDANKGVLLRGNYYNLTFSQSAQFPVIGWSGVSEVFDIRRLSDASLAVVGLSSNQINFKNNAGIIFPTNNPENYSGDGQYLFVAKISPGFSSLDWFRTSSKIDGLRYTNSNSVDVLEIYNFDVFPNVATNFRVLFKRTNESAKTYKLPSGYETVDEGRPLLFNCEYSNGLHNADVNIWSDYPLKNGYLTYNGSDVRRYDKTPLFTIVGGGLNKRKTETEFGSLSSNYIKHTGIDGSLISYTYQCGKTNYFGNEINNFILPPLNPQIVCSDILSKIAPNGKPIWKSQIIGTTQTATNPSWTAKLADTNVSGENVVLSQFTNQAQFLDNNNVPTNFSRQISTISNHLTLITNTNADGTLKWAKKLEPTTEAKKITYSSVTYDNNGNVILAGTTDDTFLLDDVAYNFNKNKVLFLMKFDANTGNILFAKQFIDMDAFMLHLDTDNENNIYLSFEPIPENWGITSYNFGSVQVPFSESANHLFLKFDSNGNTLLGKNFYANNSSSDYNYSWPHSLKFDGTDFIISGEIYSGDRISYKGIDGQIYTHPYPTSTTTNVNDFIAKVDKSGNVIWHKPIFATNRIHQNKADVDETGNVYYYINAFNKINIDGNEMQFPIDGRHSAIVKLSTADGTLKYMKDLGVHSNTIYNSSLSVLQNDVLSISGNISNQDRFLYPINDHNSSNYYIATLGKLPTPYLTPESDYLLVTNIEVPNNITDNNGEFDLITNVDWTATSNQNWLTLSSEKYTLKNQTTTNINGSGDHKIILNASQNLTGNERFAIITINGNGVASKEIIVTQSANLGITNISEKTFSIYPNPTSDYINFSEQIQDLKIFDISGKLVKSTSEKVNKIDITYLQKGTYIIQIVDKDGIKRIQKIIKK
ncbi:Por secretion system C-terminal sorting domain-containing protein [Kaistella chaponensis]|uniref:Por secretion system C-terminal sorting domain-containing protein n=1 Tax=Kaistella chaponensis TaxID=713588 RepID=A0A1N7LX54_9FLAO|nr:BACON domain-containing protein [Kaistella chaponensis]SIS78410.1 Por secretion system C-terminal sorting domain-containing protein [Kaistella chaponensis]